MKIAIVHEWLEHYAGSERVLEELLKCYPQADIFAVVDFLADDDRLFLGGRPVTTSFIQKLPLARKHFRNYLQLMPLAIEQFDLTGYDLVISSNHAVAKGVLTGPKQVHVCYMHSPIRYAWDLQSQYLRESGLTQGVKSLYVRWLLHRIRIWDAMAANGVDCFLANSSYIARRIQKTYRRDAEVVPPPVAVERFVPGDGPRSGYLVASRFVPYKRIELIAEAFRELPDCPLTIVGAGTNEPQVRRAAAGAPNITLRPPVSHAELVSLMQSAKAMVFAAEEDFGITMVEAQACGTPVIAFAEGGARDIFPQHSAAPTGVLFGTQTKDAIVSAVRRFESHGAAMLPAVCRENALRFSAALFRTRIQAAVDTAMAQFRHRGPVAAHTAHENG
ncbi:MULTISPECIES: glycosyltransferase [unclassified Acidiphilium]|jgi:glycosyltransferase involved in cell wall biosynthesis|uniref:glycosyltransferase n=1 Tax=unclassified Acidiphilium TaxID=2617493 RepID=UPI000BC528DE|nr:MULTISPECIES: glycosyltransferase [unclassified Acidiphilium]OYV57481.1 MAG: glycosyl transferase family 1 [Acidiphilium sp. 20-67-58]HQT59647.1 glycosyltransferase [Acidiphilium sp.]